MGEIQVTEVECLDSKKRLNKQIPPFSDVYQLYRKSYGEKKVVDFNERNIIQLGRNYPCQNNYTIKTEKSASSVYVSPRRRRR